jgi:hypothetical protein
VRHAGQQGLGVRYSSNWCFTSSGLTGSCCGGMAKPIYVLSSFLIITSSTTGAEAELEARYCRTTRREASAANDRSNVPRRCFEIDEATALLSTLFVAVKS